MDPDRIAQTARKGELRVIKFELCWLSEIKSERLSKDSNSRERGATRIKEAL